MHRGEDEREDERDGSGEGANGEARARRHLLPRHPSDSVVGTLAIVGIVGAVLVRDDTLGIVLLLPAVVATLAQKINGHRAAWKSSGVERAFILESSAISFYVLCGGLAVLAALQLTGLVGAVDLWVLAIGTLFVDTTVRQVREGRFA